ncbi:2-oxo acid dehydrogenase subunit E2 [Microbacterium lushaniae]|nr:2-oxo acid dehydrogenase subunit E2 [Microbacterium lushaniae]KAA9155256.1 2-oxo acid dehydrogenase subunit E2 [Microbacterium lushaniae]
MRRAAARQMVKAWEAPAFSLSVEVDMTALLVRREGTTVTDRLVALTAPVLRRHPAVNAWFADEAVTSFERVHMGIAVATDAGLVVPVMRDAQDLDLAGIAAARTDLVDRARSRSLGMDDVTGATFTITNLGMFGVASFTAIVNTPQVAILAIGATTEKYRRRDGEGIWLPTAEFTLSCDHRALDGASAAAFLADLRVAVEAGEL